MPAVYVVLTPAINIQGGAIAVIASEDWTEYLDEEGSEALGLSHQRTMRVAEMANMEPTTPREWLSVALSNLGYWICGPVIDVPSLDEARRGALKAMQALPPPPPSAREERVARQRAAADEWATLYPEAAAGEVNDPDANLALAQLMLPPVDPTRAHPWMPLAVGDLLCGFCDNPTDHPVHTRTPVAAARTIDVPGRSSPRTHVADVWDDVVARWLHGDEQLPLDLQEWRAGYTGSVDDRWYPDPFVGDLRGEQVEPRVIVLGLNPGVGYAELQARDGIWANRIRRTGYSRCLDRVAYEDPEWLRLHGHNSRYWNNLMHFARRWTREPALEVGQVLNFELYPWHSDRVVGRFSPEPRLLDNYVWAPIAETGVPEVFAFGAPWLAICTDLGWPMVARYGAGMPAVPGSEMPGWGLAVFAMPSGQRAVVSWQPGSGSPPGAARLEQLRDALRNISDT